MAMNIQPTPAALTAIPRTPATPSNSSVIPENETFHSTLKSASDTPQKISGVAKQFEALMIEQILKSGRGSGSGWLGITDDQDDQTGSMVMEMAEESFSQAMAARGGLGIAKMVTANLVSRTASSDSEAPPPASTNTDLKRR